MSAVFTIKRKWKPSLRVPLKVGTVLYSEGYYFRKTKAGMTDDAWPDTWINNVIHTAFNDLVWAGYKTILTLALLYNALWIIWTFTFSRCLHSVNVYFFKNT